MLDSMTREQFEEWMDSDELDRTVTSGRQLVKTLANIGEMLLMIEGVEAQAWKLIDGEPEPQNIVQSADQMFNAMRAIAERHNAST